MNSTPAASSAARIPFFIDFLKTAGLFNALVADCPLRYLSPNAPSKRDVLGTAMLSMLAGHKRYAHIAALRCDAVLPELLGMRKIVNEDAIRRAFKAIDETGGAVWLRRHLQYCVEPLLAEPWILDVDTTIKPLYGHQEGAVLGYNPKKPGRPSHCYHTYSMASTRLVLDVDVSPGDEHASKHSAPGLWALLDRLPRDLWPALLRGDRGFGNEEIMREAEARELPFLLKLRLQTERVRGGGRTGGAGGLAGGARGLSTRGHGLCSGAGELRCLASAGVRAGLGDVDSHRRHAARKTDLRGGATRPEADRLAPLVGRRLAPPRGLRRLPSHPFAGHERVGQTSIGLPCWRDLPAATIADICRTVMA